MDAREREVVTLVSKCVCVCACLCVHVDCESVCVIFQCVGYICVRDVCMCISVYV